jgi:hypothetical protein
MSILNTGIPSSILNLAQERTLERTFNDALFPRQLFRMEATPEVWPANLGDQMIFTRSGLIAPAIAPLIPGQDPTPQSFDTEQWSATASQYGNTIDTYMPASNVTLASLFLRNTQNLGMNAGQSLDRLARNRLFSAYLGGETSVRVLGVIAATTLGVASANGFTQQLQAGRLSPVSSLNPLAITFSSAEPANTVVGVVLADPSQPFGPATLVLGAALTTAVPLRTAVLAGTRARRLRVGGGSTVDGISSANILDLNSVISAVARLRDLNVQPHADGRYHVHLSAQAEAEIFRDNAWQRLHQSMPDSYAYKELAIGEAIGCIFFRNTQDPNVQTVNSTIALPGVGGLSVLAPEVGADITTEAGLPIRRTIVTGGGVLYEKFLDESAYISEAGVTGKVGEFLITNGSAQVMTDRIRFIMRAPLDRMQQVVSQSWSWSGDFAVPSDATTGDTAAVKRAVVIEHA